MSISRILSIVVVGALLLIGALTIYNAMQTTNIAANRANGLYDQRAGEWSAGSNITGGELDQHERHPALAVNTIYEQRRGEWTAGANYAAGKLDQHERHQP